MHHHRSLPALAAFLLSACFSPEYPANRPCGADGWCPPGQDCIDMVCRLPGYEPTRPDAAVWDGAVSDGAAPDATSLPADNADLAELSLSVPGLGPAFTAGTTAYDLHVSTLVRSLRVTARPAHPDATMTVAGEPTTGGQPSLPIAVAPDNSVVAVTVTAPAGNQKTYLVSVHTDGNLAQQVYGKADNAGQEEVFGWRVAIDGDTLAVAASYEASCATGVHDLGQADNGCVGSGAVYVFRRRGSVWEPDAYLKPSNTGIGDEFGVSLALDDDTLVVGAFHEDGPGDTLPDSGAAYVFRRVEGSWREEAYLKPESPIEDQDFGWSVAVAGSVVAVGARLENAGGTTGSGAVYLFRRNVSQWVPEARLEAPTPEENAFFGYSLAAEEDVVVVGACGHGCPPFYRPIPSPQTAGSVHVFRRGTTSWQHEDELVAPNPDAGDAFGVSVALSADTLVIGAPLEDSNSRAIDQGQNDDSFSASGAAYVFRRSGADWNAEAYLKATNTDPGDRFGASVAVSGSLVAVGALGEDSFARGIDGDPDDDSVDDAGAVYLYERAGATWNALAYIKASNTGEADELGTSVALSDDALVVGAPYEDGSGTLLVHGPMTGGDDARTDSGAVYLFH